MIARFSIFQFLFSFPSIFLCLKKVLFIAFLTASFFFTMHFYLPFYPMGSWVEAEHRIFFLNRSSTTPLLRQDKVLRFAVRTLFLRFFATAEQSASRSKKCKKKKDGCKKKRCKKKSTTRTLSRWNGK